MQSGNDCFTYIRALCIASSKGIFEKQPPHYLLQNFDVEFEKMILTPNIITDSL